MYATYKLPQRTNWLEKTIRVGDMTRLSRPIERRRDWRQLEAPTDPIAEAPVEHASPRLSLSVTLLRTPFAPASGDLWSGLAGQPRFTVAGGRSGVRLTNRRVCTGALAVSEIGRRRQAP